MPGDPSLSAGLPTPMKIFIGIFAVLFVTGLIRGVIFSVRRRRILKDAGLSPMMAGVQMETRLAQSQLLTPPPAAKSVEQRLAEVDDLYDRRVISEEEHADSRNKILGEV